LRIAVLPLSLVVGIGLVAAPAIAAPSLDLLPPSNVISFDDGAAITDGNHPLAPFSSISQPLGPGASVDDRSAGGGEEPAEETCPVLKASEKGYVDKINKARARRGKRPVSLDLEISAVAAVHSRAMKRQSELYHTGEQQLRKRVTRWELLGENVGRGGDGDSLHRAFMASPDHRRTVLDESFRHVGVAIVRDNDQVWMTVLLESQIDPGTRVKMPEGC
jgi:uncharacterized protein YkwD